MPDNELHGQGCADISAKDNGQRIGKTYQTGADQSDGESCGGGRTLKNNGCKDTGEKAVKRPSHCMFDVFLYADINQFPDG